MNSSAETSNLHSKDAFDQLIFERHLRLKHVLIDKELDVLVIVFNNGKLIHVKLSDYPKLHNASEKELKLWKPIGGGVGLHWETLDEDLSIKGLIQAYAYSNTLRDLQQGNH